MDCAIDLGGGPKDSVFSLHLGSMPACAKVGLCRAPTSIVEISAVTGFPNVALCSK